MDRFVGFKRELQHLIALAHGYTSEKVTASDEERAQWGTIEDALRRVVPLVNPWS